jgi:hypothetical protein
VSILLEENLFLGNVGQRGVENNPVLPTLKVGCVVLFKIIVIEVSQCHHQGAVHRKSRYARGVWMPTDVLSASSRQRLYIGHDKSKARDSLLHHLNTTGRTEFDALSPLILHASGEKGTARFIGRMLEPTELMLSKFAWMMLSPGEQATHWLGSLVSRRRNGKVVYEPVWTVYPYLILDACANWDLNVSHFNGPDKFAKLGAPGSVWYLGVDSVCEVCPDCDRRSLEWRTVKFQFCALCGL